jgi:hypothetical protein
MSAEACFQFSEGNTMACASRTKLTPEHFPENLPKGPKRLAFTPATGDFADAEAGDHRRRGTSGRRSAEELASQDVEESHPDFARFVLWK